MTANDHFRFLFNGHRELLTELESQAWRNINVQQLIDQCEYPTVKELFRDRWLSSEPAILELLAEGHQSFYDSTLERISSENNNGLNTCPKCNTLCRTSRAKQCPSCAHSWFE